jgi:hypothetical protein
MQKKKTAKFAHNRNESNWETFTERRKIARLYSLFKAYMGERAVTDYKHNVIEQGCSWQEN